MTVLDGFEDPWEHVRLLSDGSRNRMLVSLLERHAPGAVMVEVGCGVGLLSCVAARLGARKVFAVEPTPRWLDARRLVEANGLQDIVEVLPGRIQDLSVREVDFAVSELLNADPFLEEVLEAMDGVSAWVTPGGVLAPRRLKVWAALIRDNSSASEVRAARRELSAVCDQFDLTDGGLDALLATPGPYTCVTSTVSLGSAPALLYDLEIGGGVRPPDETTLALTVEEPGPVGGVVVWFEAEYDDELTMANPPGEGGHWGHLVSCWPKEFGARQGDDFEVIARIDDGHIEVSPAR